MLDCKVGFAVAGLLAGAAGLAPVLAPLTAQEDSVTIVAGPAYEAGDLHEALLGDDYRTLWATPIQVEVLNLSTFAGGLELEKLGGGKQTMVLHFKGADQRDYVFRSVDKDPSLAQEPALQSTLVGDIIRDQTSSLHPAAAAVAAPLLEAAGVLHVTPRLVVLPDDPRLGEYREEFAGVLGWIEERPNEVVIDEEDAPGTWGLTKITGTDKLLERLEESPEDRVDARAFLNARLVDLFFADWDRHYDQWRWGRVEGDEVDVWVPIPRDRDYAFAQYDGLLVDLAGNVVDIPQFGPEYEGLPRLLRNARALDRLLLSELPRPVWDSIASTLQARLTDEVIERAVRAIPPEYQRLSAAELAATLKARRDRLSEVAERFYERLARAVNVEATDESEVAVVERQPGGLVEVEIFRDEETDAPRGEPYFRRTFRPEETGEVRIDLHGGDDRAIVRGNVRESILVRVIGGGDDDVLVDSSRVAERGTWTAFYDEKGENRFVTGPDTEVDEREYEPPPPAPPGIPRRDWGSTRAFSPFLDFRNTEGLVIGVGPVWTRYGFRRDPYAYRIGVRAMYGFGSEDFGLAAFGDYYPENSRTYYSFQALASQLEGFRFYGLGNETPSLEEDRVTVEQAQVAFSPAINLPIAREARLAIGPVVKYTWPELESESVWEEPDLFGLKPFGQAGMRADAWLDRRDDASFPRSGAYFRLGAAAYPGVWDVPEPFGNAYAEARGYLPLPLPLGPTLALRAGGEKVWGDFPIQEAAFLGGSRTLRGFDFRRFAGEGSVYGSAELRAPLAEVSLLVRGDLGASILGDVGRVFVEGDDSDEWHTAVGGSMWFSFEIRDRIYTFTTTYANGEENSWYVRLGVPF